MQVIFKPAKVPLKNTCHFKNHEIRVKTNASQFKASESHIEINANNFKARLDGK